MRYELRELQKADPVLCELIRREERRQESTLELIASESIQSPQLLEINACAFNNKTAVGRIGDQHMAGSGVADALMRLTAERACALYGAEHANIQPYSGSTANYSVYSACLSPGDTVLAMDPNQGGHATHGQDGNISAYLYRFEFYGVDRQSLLIDYDAMERKALAVRPKLIIAGSSTYSQPIDYERMADIARRCGALLHADIAHYTGVIAAGLLPSPVPYADFVTGSTTKTICGPRSGFALCKAAHAEQLDRCVYPGIVASMHLQTMAAMAHAFYYAGTERFRRTMRDTVRNAQALSEALQARGFPVLTGGTQCHLLVADVRPKGMDARRLVKLLEAVGISTNPVRIPYDTPGVRNGLRVGATTCTQRGMGPEEMRRIADIMGRVADSPDDDSVREACAREVGELTRAFPLYGQFEAAANEKECDRL